MPLKHVIGWTLWSKVSVREISVEVTAKSEPGLNWGELNYATKNSYKQNTALVLKSQNDNLSHVTRGWVEIVIYFSRLENHFNTI